jgi:hypothetical protein
VAERECLSRFDEDVRAHQHADGVEQSGGRQVEHRGELLEAEAAAEHRGDGRDGDEPVVGSRWRREVFEEGSPEPPAWLEVLEKTDLQHPLTAYAQSYDALALQPPVDEVRQLVVVALAELEQARASGKMMLAVWD